MRVLLINSVCGIRSTGRICTDLAQQFEKEGHEVKIAYGRVDEVPEQFKKYAVRIGNDMDLKLHALRTRVLDEHGFGSKRATEKFLKWADEYDPDLVWLHNIHGYYINVEMLFQWIKSRSQMEVKWTLHDCWAFTGHCSYFSAVGCERWKCGCRDCTQKGTYPESKLKDNCEKNYVRKKKAFTGVKKLTLITPSKWLADLTRESFLKEYPVEVVYNTVDTNVFKPTKSDFRKKYNLENKKVVLGVASTWEERKGIYDLIQLSQMLSSEYVIILVGISKATLNEYRLKCSPFSHSNLQNMEHLIYRYKKGVVIPQNVEVLYKEIVGNNYESFSGEKSSILCIPRTNDTRTLAEIYTAADIFVNPTYEDNYPTVNLEAIACGTKVITYNTGGCNETIINDDRLEKQ